MSGQRYSIIPGDFATDARADVIHFRVLNLIGRHTNAHGWCRLKQANMAGALGVARETVNRKLANLVAWGYIEKRAIDATGRAIFYRTIMDRQAPPAVSDDDEAHFLDVGPEHRGPDGPVSDGSHVGYNADAELHTTCDPPLTSGVIPGITSGVITGNHNKNDPSLTTKSPPNPPVGGSSGKPGDRQWRTEALAALRAAGRHRDGVEHLIAPLLASDRRLSLGKGREAAAALAELAEAAHGIAKPALDAAVKRLVASKRKLTVQRIRSEVDVARRAGALVVVRRGSPQWQRWREHFEKTDPKQARTMGRFEAWQVPFEWPPAQHERGAA